MTQKNLENIMQEENFQTLLRTAHVNGALKMYEENPNQKVLSEITDEDNLGKIVSPHYPELLKNTPNPVDDIRKYIKDSEEKSNESFNAIKGDLYNIFQTDMNNTLQKIEKDISEKINNDKNLKNASAEQIASFKKMNIMESVYQNVANILLSANFSPKGESTLAKLYVEVKDLLEKPEKAQKAAQEEIVEKDHLYKSRASYINVNPKEWISIKMKHLAKEVLKEQNGKYAVDLDKFKEVFGNYETGLSLASYFAFLNLNKQAKGAK